MATFEVTTPNGTFEVDAPDEQTALDALQKEGLFQPVPQVTAGEDVARSAASGLRSGTEGLAGMMGDAAERTGDALGWAAGKVGFGEGVQDAARTVGRRVNPFGFAPTTAELQDITKTGLGEHYQPQTTAGEYTRTVAEFVPGAVAGPGGVIRKGAMAIVPGISSEFAGQMTEGTPYEPYARAGAAIAAGGLAAGLKGSPVKMAAKGAPSQEVVKETADGLYTQLREAGIRYDADSYANMVRETAQTMRKSYRPVGDMKQAYEWVRELAKGIGKSPDFDDIDAVRSQIMGEARQAYRSGNDKFGKALDSIVDKLDDFERGAPLATNSPIPQAELNTMRSSARSAALKNIKQREINKIIERADTYQAGREAGIRNGLSNFLRSGKGMQLIKGDERKVLLEIAHGRKGGQVLSKFGLNFFKGSGNSTFMPLLLALGLGDTLGTTAATAVGAAGTAAKAINPWRTSRALDTTMAAMRSGKLNDKSTMDALKAERMQALVRSLLASQQGVAQSTIGAPDPLAR